jgi:membrane fusion protein (multidrug efflux system)
MPLMYFAPGLIRCEPRLLALCAVMTIFGHTQQAAAQSGLLAELDANMKIEFAGRAAARDIIEIFPQARGTVTEAILTIGQRVNKGEVLIKIDPKAYQYIADGAAARLKHARIRMETVVKELNRMQQLVDRKLAITSKLYTLSVARDLAQGSVEEAEAELNSAELNLSHTVIKSPIGGFVSQINVDPGDFVGHGDEPAIVILEYNPIRVVFKLDPDMHVRLRGHALEGNILFQLKFSNGDIYPYQGQYVGSSHLVNPTTGKIDHLLIFPNADLLVLPGLPVTVIAKARGAPK